MKTDPLNNYVVGSPIFMTFDLIHGWVFGPAPVANLIKVPSLEVISVDHLAKTVTFGPAS